MKDLIDRVNKWGVERGLTNAHAQILKACSEWGELCDAVLKRDDAAIHDAIGDIAVCLINYARCAGMEFFSASAHCMGASLSDIGRQLSTLLFDEETTRLHFSKTSLVTGLFGFLSGVAQQHRTTLRDCLAGSLDIIEKRTGVTTADGVFIKSE